MKKIILILLLITLTARIEAIAQIAFSKEYGGEFNEDGRWMEQMPDSGFILTGGTTTYSNGQTDIWLVRTDPYGNTLWQKSIGGADFDFANMVKPVSGGFVICGVTNRSGSDDGILVKTDNSGNTIWTTLVGDVPNIQWFEGVVQTSNGWYTAVGVTTGPVTNGNYDILLVRFNAEGVVQWQKNIGGDSYEIGNSIQQTADGGYILSGQTYSYGNLDGDYYLVKTDSSGNVQWDKTYAQPHLQECHYAQITPDGGYILVGDADTVPNGLGDTDIWMIKTDSNGNIVWDNVYGGSKKDGGKTVENTSDGGFIVAGITRSFGLINPNYFLFKIDAFGNLDWKKNYGGVKHDHAYRAIETSDYGFAIFGYYKNNTDYKNWALVKLPPNAGITKDLAIDEIIAPTVNLCRRNNVNLSVDLGNYGTVNESNILVTLLISFENSVTTLVDTFTGTITPTSTGTLNFTQTYDFNLDGVYTLKAFTQHRNGDISYSNDTTITSINVIPPITDPVTTSSLSCNTGSFTLTSSPGISSDSMFWYDSPVNGKLFATGNSYITPTINNTTTYYVQSQKGKGSKVGMTDNLVGSGSTSSGNYLKFDSRKIFTLVSVLVYSEVAGNRTIELRNSAGSVLQSKTINLPIAIGGIRVYLNFTVPKENDLQLALTNGSAKLFRNSTGAVYPYSVSQTLEIYGANSSNPETYYYFYDWYVFVPSQNCVSNRVPVQAIISSGSTTAFDGSRCGNGTVTLSANSNTTLGWYNVPSGGVSLGTSNTFITPSLSSNTTYYLEEGSCPNRIAVQAKVNAISSQPSASDVTRCGPGTVNLIASSSDPIYWYNAPSNGTQVYFGSPFTTPYLNVTKTYYAVAGSICPSTPKTVQAIINSAVIPIVTGATACGPASVTLFASSPDPLKWYTVSSGGSSIATTSSYTTPVLANPVTYYVEAGTICPSPRVPVVANIITIDPPVVTGASRCGSGSLVLSAQSTNSVTWWTAANGGTQLSSGQIFTTPTLNATTVYYASASGSGCNSTRSPVTATVNITTPPIPNTGSHCGAGTVTLTATASDSIFWFNVASGGSHIATGTTFTTPSISTTTIYYVQAGGNCPSIRVSVNAVIASPSLVPITSGAFRCGAGNVTLTATSPDPITWFDAPNGNIVGTGASFITPTISTSTTYYAKAGISGCFSDPASAVATINTLPAGPVVTNAQSCGPAQLILTATSANTITWYNQPTGGSILNTGPSYSSTFNITTTVYAEASNGTCVSNRVPGIATIYTIPNVDLGPPILILNSGQSYNLSPGAGFSIYLWSTGATTQSITVNSAGVYSVIVTDANNCQNSDSIIVTIVDNVSNESILNKAILIYPNPSSGMLNVKVNNQLLKFDLQIIDVTGRIIVSDNHTINGMFNKNYNLIDFAKGIYYLRIFSTEGNATRTFIIQ